MSFITLIQVYMELLCGGYCIFFGFLTWSGRKYYDSQRNQVVYSLFSGATLLLMDPIVYLCAGNISPAAKFGTNAALFLECIADLCIAYYFLIYSYSLLAEKNIQPDRKVIRIIAGFCILEGINLVVNIFTGSIFYFDETNTYIIGKGYPLYVLGFLFPIVVIANFIWKLRKSFELEDLKVLGITIGLPIFGIFLQAIFQDSCIANILIGVSLIIRFMSYEKMLFIRYMNQHIELEREKRERAETDAQLAEYRTRMINSQIHPHFMFNSLNAIKGLILIDPTEASNAVDYLAKFLRASLDALNKSDLIPIRQEIENTRAYLMMQKYRFGSSLKFEVENESTDFMLPAFTIQPLVENAIHAIRDSEEGSGTIKIKIFSDETKHTVLVEDDGGGFDPEQVGNDGRGHYGIRIVNERLEKMCGGSFEIRSTIGEGTTCEITVPAAKAKA